MAPGVRAMGGGLRRIRLAAKEAGSDELPWGVLVDLLWWMGFQPTRLVVEEVGGAGCVASWLGNRGTSA